ncbi:MAG: hypothetical protein AAFP84_11625, partial [Actinomycetota bacterium]
VEGGGEMSVIRVPSAALAATPWFECDVPDRWSASEAPGVVVRLGPDDDESVSLVVSAVRVDRGLDLRSVAVRSFAQQRMQHPDVVIDTQRVGRFGDRLTYLRSVTVPGDVDRAQLHALFFAPSADGRSVADVFSVVGTCPAGRLDECGSQFVDVIASFRFLQPSTPGSAGDQG